LGDLWESDSCPSLLERVGVRLAGIERDGETIKTNKKPNV